MSKSLPRRLLALSVSLILLLSACASGGSGGGPGGASDGKNSGAQVSSGDVLTWTRWNGFDNFLELASRTYPEIKWEYTAYAGGEPHRVQLSADAG